MIDFLGPRPNMLMGFYSYILFLSSNLYYFWKVFKSSVGGILLYRIGKGNSHLIWDVLPFYERKS
ncbi:hypothetical protein C1H46_045631 [Malus baccata]|uniref:Uncharacterized protein n=1 Tax=Malus baccata TaxID=106549 RepID=A0A540K3L6_MALBA|nr:hypothetical protein C1H46_045631 [Malus baccata]